MKSLKQLLAIAIEHWSHTNRLYLGVWSISAILMTACGGGGGGGNNSEVNQSPVAGDDNVTALEATPVTFDVLANDSDPEGKPLTITGFTQPGKGTLVQNQDKTFTYTSTTGFTFTTTDSFNYTISDGQGGTANASVEITLLASIARVSIASDGTQGDGDSYSYGYGHSSSADGRFVAFYSKATTLVPNDTNGSWDVFVYDRQTGRIERISVASNGIQGDSDSFDPAISADGRYVAFDSRATNLVIGDTNGKSDIFVHDRQTGITERVSLADNGTQGDEMSDYPAISADGRYVAFESKATNLVLNDTNGNWDVFVYDRQTHSIACVSVDPSGNPGNGDSYDPAMNADGRLVAFDSDATNLVPAKTSVPFDVFVRDRQNSITELVSVSSGGSLGDGDSQYPALSADGRYVAFESDATNLVPNDTNKSTDVFVHDRQTGVTERASAASNGAESDGDSHDATLSADGRYIAFDSRATNLVPNDTNKAADIFVRDRQSSLLVRVSIAADAIQSNKDSQSPSLSADGRYVVFESDATNLVPGDTNGFSDVFAAPDPLLIRP